VSDCKHSLVPSLRTAFAKTSTHILHPCAFGSGTLETTTQYHNIGNPIKGDSHSSSFDFDRYSNLTKTFNTSPTTPKDS
jgi:hypothetical protein